VSVVMVRRFAVGAGAGGAAVDRESAIFPTDERRGPVSFRMVWVKTEEGLRSRWVARRLVRRAAE